MWNLFVYKRNKEGEEEKEIQQIWLLEIFHIECFQTEEKKGNT